VKQDVRQDTDEPIPIFLARQEKHEEFCASTKLKKEERRKLKASKIYRESDGVAPDLTRDGCVNILRSFISL